MAFTDSRGIGVHEHILKLNKTGEYLDLEPYRGATFNEIFASVEHYLKDHNFDVVYMAAGVNDITTKNKKTGGISFEWGDGKELSEYMCRMLTGADNSLQKNFPAARIVFCPLIGCELRRVVNKHSTTDREQEAVDNAVWDFNEKVFEINARRGTFSPALHHHVHYTITCSEN